MVEISQRFERDPKALLLYGGSYDPTTGGGSGSHWYEKILRSYSCERLMEVDPEVFLPGMSSVHTAEIGLWDLTNEGRL